jgi:hypothetical protein
MRLAETLAGTRDGGGAWQVGDTRAKRDTVFATKLAQVYSYVAKGSSHVRWDQLADHQDDLWLADRIISAANLTEHIVWGGEREGDAGTIDLPRTGRDLWHRARTIRVRLVAAAPGARIHFDRSDDHRGDSRDSRRDRLAELQHLCSAQQDHRSDVQPKRHADQVGTILLGQSPISWRMHRCRGGCGSRRQDISTGDNEVLQRYLCLSNCADLYDHCGRRFLRVDGRLFLHDRPDEHSSNDRLAYGLVGHWQHLLGHQKRRFLLT